MKSQTVIAALLLSICIGVAPAPAQQDAIEVLNRAAKTYESMKTLRAEADLTMGATAPGLLQSTSMRLLLTLAPPGKIRIENKGPMSVLMIFDGQAGWLYMPALNKYSKLPASAAPLSHTAGSTQAGSTGTGAALPGAGLIPDFRNVAEGIKEARIVRSETLHLDGAGIDCYVVDVAHKPQAALSPDAADGAAPRQELTHETVWVDKTRNLIVRLSSDAVPVAGQDPANTAELKSTITFHKLILDGPIADDTFVFKPPAGATELDLTQFMPQAPAPESSPAP